MKASARLAELQRTFVAPSRLAHSRPRAVQLTALGRALTVVACVLFAASIATGLAMYSTAREQAENRRALVNDGVMVNAEVTRLWENDDDRRRVAYRFVVDGRPYEGRVQVSTERRRTLQVGSAFPIRYVPADPRVHDRGGTPATGMPMWVPFVVALGIAAAGVICLLTIDRQRRLLAEGRAAPAIVTAHATHKSTHGGTHRSLTFEFPLLSGAVATGKSATSSKPPAIGSVITILYDPDRPGRNQVYPLSLVKPIR